MEVEFLILILHAFLLVFVSHSGHVLNLQANLRACNEELRSHVDDLKQDLEVQRMAISRSDQEKVLTFNTAYRSSSSTLFEPRSEKTGLQSF